MSTKYQMQTILLLVPYSKKVRRKKKSSLHLATFKVKNTVIITSYIITKYVNPWIHFYLSSYIQHLAVFNKSVLSMELIISEV